jgi:hypothetical protein
MSDEFDDGGEDPGRWWDDDGWSPPGPGPKDAFDDAAERDKLLGALGDALTYKDSAAAAQLIKDLLDFHGSDTNIDGALDVALRRFKDFGKPDALFDACREVADCTRREGPHKDTAMRTLLELASQIAEKSVSRAKDGLTSVLQEAPDDNAMHAEAVEKLFDLAARTQDPEESLDILNALRRQADDGTPLQDRVIDAMMGLAERCRENDPDVAREVVRDALFAMPDGDPRQEKAEAFQSALDEDAGKNRAQSYQDQAKPVTPDEFRQRFG